MHFLFPISSPVSLFPNIKAENIADIWDERNNNKGPDLIKTANFCAQNPQDNQFAILFS